MQAPPSDGQKYGHSPPYQQPGYAAVACLVRYGPVPGRSRPARSTVPESALAACAEPAMALRPDLADGIGGASEPTADLRSGAGDHRPGPQTGGPGHVPVQRVRRAARLPAPVIGAGWRADPRPRESPGSRGGADYRPVQHPLWRGAQPASGCPAGGGYHGSDDAPGAPAGVQSPVDRAMGAVLPVPRQQHRGRLAAQPGGTGQGYPAQLSAPDQLPRQSRSEEH